MKCKYCGEEIVNDSVFCEHCGKKVCKRSNVNIIWCLLPTLFFASLNVSIALINDSSCLGERAALAFLPMTIILIIIIICGIKKQLNIPFVVLAVLFLITNSIKVYIASSTEHIGETTSSIDVHWNNADGIYNNTNQETIQLEMKQFYYYKNKTLDNGRVETILKDVADDVVNKMKNTGYDSSHSDYVWIRYNWYHEEPWAIALIELFLVIVYLTYAFVVFKKKTKND